MADRSYGAVLARRGEIQRRAVGVDYEAYEQDGVAFDYEALLRSSGYGLRRRRAHPAGGEGRRHAAARAAAADTGSRATSRRREREPRILVKDEAATRPGASRRAAPRSRCTRRRGSATTGVIAATSGNYGAAVASQAAMRGPRLHRPPGGLRLGRARPAGDRREGPRLRVVRRRGLAADRRAGALLHDAAPPRGDGLLQRLALHAACGRGHRDARAGDRRRRCGAATGAIPTPSSSPTRAEAT